MCLINKEGKFNKVFLQKQVNIPIFKNQALQIYYTM